MALLPDTTAPASLVLLRSAQGMPCAKRLALVEGRPAVVGSYGMESRWRVDVEPVPTFGAFVAALEAAAARTDTIIIRGQVDPAKAPADYDPAQGVLRRLSDKAGGIWTPAARTWVPLDFDDVPRPVGAGPGVEAELTALADQLPAPFRGRSFWYQYTSSHGLSGAGTLRVRLWFLADGPVTDEAVCAALAPSYKALCLDPSIYRAVQPIYVARPALDGIPDPVPARTGVVCGFDGETVCAADLPHPTRSAAGLSTAAYFAAVRGGASVRHPVELANARARIRAGTAKASSRHHHATGVACELFMLGATWEEVAAEVEHTLTRQGRAPNAGEVAGVLTWAAGRHASGGLTTDTPPAAAVFPEGEPPPTPAVAVEVEAPAPDAPALVPRPQFGKDAGGNAVQWLQYRHPVADDDRAPGYLYSFASYGEVDHAWTGTHYAPMAMGTPSALDCAIRHDVGEAVSGTVKAIRERAWIAPEPAPFWRAEKAGDPPASMLLPFVNGVLDLDAWLLDPGAALRKHDPRLFSLGVIPYRYDPAATCPAFDAWLAALFDDQESRDEFVKMLGYLFLPDNPRHRIFVLSGASRSGKGVAQRLVRALLGPGSTTAASLSSLGSSFGLAPLIGKRCAVVGEMNDHKETNTTQVAIDALKAISGGDAVTIDRKFREPVVMPLPVKFLIACNKFPRLLDPSGALVERMTMFRFVHSYVGREDPDLERRLAAELPGIANRALAGLRSVLFDGFRRPPSQADFMAHVRACVSPVGDFLNDALEPEDAAAAPGFISKADLYAAYRVWCSVHGDIPIGGRRLTEEFAAARPRCCVHRRSERDGTRTPGYLGPGLRLTAEARAWVVQGSPALPGTPAP